MFPINSVARPTVTSMTRVRPLGKLVFFRHICQSSHGPTTRTVIDSFTQTAQAGTLGIVLSCFMQALVVL